MDMTPAGFTPKNDCAGEGQQKLYTAGPFCRQRERLTSSNPQLSDNNKNLIVKPQMGA
jgi:hypothetical protein